MNAINVAFGITLILDLSLYVFLVVLTSRNFYPVLDFQGCKFSPFTSAQKENYLRRLREQRKTMFLDQSIAMVVAAGIFTIFPQDTFVVLSQNFFYWCAGLCMFMAGVDYYQYRNTVV